ncbi:hypothetical protein P3S67_006530 [Capsicum chacoense]
MLPIFPYDANFQPLSHPSFSFHFWPHLLRPLQHYYYYCFLSYLSQFPPNNLFPLCFINQMADWGPVLIAVVLFVLLSPGLLFQLPGRGRVVEFGGMQTSGVAILVHAVIYFGLITILLIAVGVHVYTG